MLFFLSFFIVKNLPKVLKGIFDWILTTICRIQAGD